MCRLHLLRRETSYRLVPSDEVQRDAPVRFVDQVIIAAFVAIGDDYLNPA
jgi:hypothetical protein